MKFRFFIFKTQKNKRYNYTPRFYEGKEKGNFYEINSSIRKDRETPTETMGTQWNQARQENRHRGNTEINKRLIIIFAILLLICLYFLDFDLSIFFKKK